VYEHILYDVRDGVAVITLNRPDRRNALGVGPTSNRAEIVKALAAADADDAVGCVLFVGAGKVFCAGGDLTSMPAVLTPLQNDALIDEITRFNAAVHDTRKPVVGAIHGRCLGAALGFIAQFDIALAAEDTLFGLVEGRIGHPGATDIVPLVGPAWAKFMMLTGEMIDAPLAAQIGLILMTLPDDRIQELGFSLAQRIARLPRSGVILNKTTINTIVESSGATAGRSAGRARDVITIQASKQAQAPDGRTFVDILAKEGVRSMVAARDEQFVGAWLGSWLDKGERG
jgi:enoyl-CoA hydratase/carnithine racemase